jgi:hypothetical protein
MKKTKAAIAATFLITLATSIVLFFVVFINFLQHVSSGKELDFVMLTALLTSLAVCILSNLRYDYVKRKESANALIKAGEMFRELMKSGSITSNEVPKTGSESVHVDKSLIRFDGNNAPAKRSHHSRKNSFDVQKAVERGMAMYVDGKRHVYVSLKQSPAGTSTEVRGISNGVFYGYLDHIGKGIHNNHNQIKGYLINV